MHARFRSAGFFVLLLAVAMRSPVRHLSSSPITTTTGTEAIRLLSLLVPAMASTASTRSAPYPAVPSATCASGEEEGTLSEWVTTSAGVRMPRLIYGTAWKEERTAGLVKRAVRAGFRGIDTALQLKHYRESYVGDALAELFMSGGFKRDEFFIQTKVNKNQAAEYLPAGSISEQVSNSIAISLKNLRLDVIDSLVLHSPYNSHRETMEAWRAMEEAVAAGHVRQLGVSNVNGLAELRAIHADAKVKPAVVQQRFHSTTGFEVELREWCAREGGAIMQSFWTLTANSKSGRRGKDAVVSAPMATLARGYDVTPQVLFFRYVMQRGMTPLTGTSSDDHMAQDLQARLVPLSEADAAQIDALLLGRG